MEESNKIFIAGGTYIEQCVEPSYYEVYGSGLRAACAIAEKGFSVSYFSCIGREELEIAQTRCDLYTIDAHLTQIEETVLFEYYHPLAKPTPYSISLDKGLKLPALKAERALYYGMIEAELEVHSEFLVYDPQNGIPFRDTGSSAKHLALVLNKNEALSLSKLGADNELTKIGKQLLVQEGAEVVVIKDGSNGGWVITKEQVHQFPVYVTNKVWPIGSGDIFSASFAWKWMMEGLPPAEAADLASKYTAEFCETRCESLPLLPQVRVPLAATKRKLNIYIAAPLFTTSERWLINELRNALQSFGNSVFSPYHDVGLWESDDTVEGQKYIAKADIDGLDNCDVVIAVLSGLDAGTLFEVGYAVAKKKKVVVFTENINPVDLTMIVGSGCIIVEDLSTAVYTASW